MDAIVFPVVLTHELGVRVEAAPVVLVSRQDLLDVSVVLASSSHELTHTVVRSPLLLEDLLERLGVLLCAEADPVGWGTFIASVAVTHEAIPCGSVCCSLGLLSCLISCHCPMRLYVWELFLSCVGVQANVLCDWLQIRRWLRPGRLVAAIALQSQAHARIFDDRCTAFDRRCIRNLLADLKSIGLWL